MPQPWQIREANLCHILYQYRNIVRIRNNDIPDLVYIIQQPNPPHDICLVVPDDEVTADIDIAFLNGGIDVQRGYPQVGELPGVYLDLIGLYPAAKADDIGDTRYGAELPVDDPVLDRF